jgi:signal transduction histidine kinase
MPPGFNFGANTTVRGMPDLAPTLSDVLHMAGRAVGADISQIYLFDPHGKALVLSGSIPDNAEGLGVPTSVISILDKIIDTNCPARLTRSELGPDWSHTRVRAALFLPLVWDSRALGGMAFLWLDEELGAGEGSLDMGALLAPQVALALENASLREALAKTRNELMGQIQELLGTIQKTQHEARESSQQSLAFGQRLRTPLTTLELYLDLICAHPDRTRHYADVLSREIKRLQSMVDEMLTLGQAQVGKTELDRTTLDLTVVAREIVSSSERLARSRGQMLRLRVDPSCPLVSGDPEMLKQAIANLVSNAVQYTPRGGRISLTVEPRFRGGRSWATVTVADSGYGISQEELEHIFEAFYRGRAARVSEASGMGLGLTISRKVVETHGGTVDAQSLVGEGSTFTIWLPAGAISVQIGSDTPENSFRRISGAKRNLV